MSLLKVIQRVAGTILRAEMFALVLLLTAWSAAAANFRFCGTTVDSYDRPLAGAGIRLYLEEIQAPLPAQLVLKTNTVSAKDGTFELSIPAGYGYIVATKPGLALGWRLWNETGEPNEVMGRLKLGDSTGISGIVVDETGKPEADAQVFVSEAYFGRELSGGLYDNVSASWLRECLTARTGPGGQFRIKGIPPDSRLNLDIAKNGRAFHKNKRSSTSLNSMMCVEDQTGIKLVTEAAGTIEGKVSLPVEEKLPPGTLLWLQDEEHNRLVNGQVMHPASDGVFRFTNVSSGTYWVHAAFGTNPVPDWVADSSETTVLAGDSSDGVDITATKGGILEVALSYTNGGGAASDVSVKTFRQSFQTASAAQSDGIVRVRHPANEFQLELWRERYRIKRTNAAVHFDRTNRVEMQVNPAPRIGGIVTNREGAPVAGINVFVFPACGDCSQAAAKTDATGRYSIHWDTQAKVGQDVFFLIARDIGRNLAGSTDVEAGETNYDLCVDEGLTIAGQVQDGAGKRITNAMVHLAVWSGQGGDWFDEQNPPRLDAQGRFEIRALPRERVYSVKGTARGFGEAQSKKVSVDMETATRISILPLVLDRADLMVAGRVVDEEDKPVPWANVYVSSPVQAVRHVRSDANGAFEAAELCPGELTINVSQNKIQGKANCQAGDTNVVIAVKRK